MIRVAIVILTTSLAVLALIGPEELVVLDYTGEVDLRNGDGALSGEGRASDLRIAKEMQPAATLNLPLDPLTDGSWILLGVGNPTLILEVENATGMVVYETQGMSSVGVSNLASMGCYECFYWANASVTSGNFQIRLEEKTGFTFPVITIATLEDEQTGAISVVVRVRSGTPTSRVEVSITDPIVRLDGTDHEFLGPTTLTVTDYETVFLMFSTTSHAFTLPAAARVAWWNGPLALSGVSGALRSGSTVREFRNATLETLDVPRLVALETKLVMGDFSPEIGLNIELEGTLVEVADSAGSGVVGQQRTEPVALKGWLDRPTEGFIALAMIISLGILSLLATRGRNP